jgi:hypothetical protein
VRSQLEGPDGIIRLCHDSSALSGLVLFAVFVLRAVPLTEKLHGPPTTLFMIFEYADGDLLDLLKYYRGCGLKLSLDHVTCLTRQVRPAHDGK